MSANLAKTLRKEIKATHLGRYIPKNFRRNWYVVTLVWSSLFSVGFILYEALLHLSLLELFWGGVSIIAADTASWGIYIALDLWFNADHAQIGRFGPFPMVNYKGNKSIFPMLYRANKGKEIRDDKGRPTREHPHGTLEVYEILRIGQRLSRLFTGQGPVPVTPIKQRTVVADMQSELDATGVMPQPPSGVDLFAGRFQGRTYITNADYYSQELGSEIPICPPEILEWISHAWPNDPLGPHAKVLMAWKLLPDDAATSTDERTTDVTAELLEKEYRYRMMKQQWEEALENRQQGDSARPG
jgi:hypothetical protein